MKINKRILISIILVIAIVLGITTQVSAVGENITTTVTATPENGETVKPGDEITYTITMKNNSKDNYFLPTLITQVPEGTEYVGISTTSESTIEPEVDEATGIITCMGHLLQANSEITFTLKVKVLETASENILYGNITVDDEESAGVIMYMLFNTLNENDINIAMEVIESDAFQNATSLEEIQNLLGTIAYVNIVTQPQTLIVYENGEETTNPGTEQGSGQENQEATNTIKEPVVEGEKPTELPKTGRDFCTVIFATATLMIVTGVIILMKKQSK